MRRLGAWIVQALRAPLNEAAVACTRAEVRALCRRFAVPALMER